MWNSKLKTYFFGHMERFRKVGATTKPVYTIATEKMRMGDFSEWPDPIFDPVTLRENPSYNASAPNWNGGVSAPRNLQLGAKITF